MNICILFYDQRNVCHCIKNSAQENNKPDFTSGHFY